MKSRTAFQAAAGGGREAILEFKSASRKIAFMQSMTSRRGARRASHICLDLDSRASAKASSCWATAVLAGPRTKRSGGIHAGPLRRLDDAQIESKLLARSAQGVIGLAEWA